MVENGEKTEMGSRQHEQSNQHRTVLAVTVFLLTSVKGKKYHGLKCPW